MGAVHFLGNAHVTRTACGRQVLSWWDVSTQPLHTAQLAQVTCKACRKALGQAQAVAAVKEGRELAQRCDQLARRGTGQGVCDAPLDAHGVCVNAGRHI